MTTYSALTTDVQRAPEILQGMKAEAYGRTPSWMDVRIIVTITGDVTTVTAVAS